MLCPHRWLWCNLAPIPHPVPMPSYVSNERLRHWSTLLGRPTTLGRAGMQPQCCFWGTGSHGQTDLSVPSWAQPGEPVCCLLQGEFTYQQCSHCLDPPSRSAAPGTRKATPEKAHLEPKPPSSLTWTSAVAFAWPFCSPGCLASMFLTVARDLHYFWSEVQTPYQAREALQPSRNLLHNNAAFQGLHCSHPQDFCIHGSFLLEVSLSPKLPNFVSWCS